MAEFTQNLYLTEHFGKRKSNKNVIILKKGLQFGNQSVIMA